MANRWPDGGEAPLTRGEKLVLGMLATFAVSLPFDLVVLSILRLIGPPPPWPMIVVTCVLGLAAGALWVRPWETGPPSRR
jgi:hypothetical protein